MRFQIVVRLHIGAASPKCSEWDKRLDHKRHIGHAFAALGVGFDPPPQDFVSSL
jgi:hypothetical protein